LGLINYLNNTDRGIGFTYRWTTAWGPIILPWMVLDVSVV